MAEACDNLDNDCDGVVDEFFTGSCGIGGCEKQGFCTGGVFNCVPGDPSPEICDGVDNDCDGNLPGTEVDGDGDGFPICAECDDANANIYPGAPEINDGLDNQCPGDPGFGLADEISSVAGFHNALDPTEFSWNAQPDAIEYQVGRSFSADLTICDLLARTTDPTLNDPEVPPVGALFTYVARAAAPNVGSWGRDSSGAERFAVCTLEGSCINQQDDDGDGLVDCADPECAGNAACALEEFSFQDTKNDDLVPAALRDFLGAAQASPLDYFYFEIIGKGGDQLAWCAERADFYRDSYLALAASGGSINSGAWSKWHRSPSTGDTWTGPDSGAYVNDYGPGCFETESWCSERDLGGLDLAVRPSKENACEADDASNPACGNGTWSLTIRIASERSAACGF